MFIVVVTHNTGHGESSCPILITEDFNKALKTAREAETLGYEFYSDETGVGIYDLEINTPYGKKEFKWLDGDLPPKACVFYRSYNSNSSFWKETWFRKI